MAIDPDLGQAVREAAAKSGVSVSRWMGEAARDRLRNQLLGAALDAWEAENGPFTDEELAEASRDIQRAEAIRRRAG